MVKPNRNDRQKGEAVPSIEGSPIGMDIDPLAFMYYYVSRDPKHFPSPESDPKQGGFG